MKKEDFYHLAIEQEYEKSTKRFMITIWINHKTIRRRPIYDPRLFENALVIFTPNNGMVKNVKICNGKYMLLFFSF